MMSPWAESKGKGLPQKDPMRYFYVYTLKCKDDSYYTGVTNDMERRWYEHETELNKTSCTHNKRPVKLVFCEDFLDFNQAIAFEKQVKGWTRIKKEAIISDNWNKLKELSVCKNESSHKNKWCFIKYASTPLSITSGMSPWACHVERSRRECHSERSRRECHSERSRRAGNRRQELIKIKINLLNLKLIFIHIFTFQKIVLFLILKMSTNFTQ